MGEMVLLGAGASVDAGVPDAYGMTNAIAKRFRGDPVLKKHAHVISFVVGGLLFEAGKNNQDPLTAGVNVEELFNAVQLLAERNTLEAAPFVGSQKSGVSPPFLPKKTNRHRITRDSLREQEGLGLAARGR